MIDACMFDTLFLAKLLALLCGNTLEVFYQTLSPLILQFTRLHQVTKPGPALLSGTSSLRNDPAASGPAVDESRFRSLGMQVGIRSLCSRYTQTSKTFLDDCRDDVTMTVCGKSTAVMRHYICI
jgi:hypothetical protein